MFVDGRGETNVKLCRSDLLAANSTGRPDGAVNLLSLSRYKQGAPTELSFFYSVGKTIQTDPVPVFLLRCPFVHYFLT